MSSRNDKLKIHGIAYTTRNIRNVKSEMIMYSVVTYRHCVLRRPIRKVMRTLYDTIYDF